MAKGEEPIKLKAFHRNALQFFGITGGQRDGFPASTGLRSTLAFFGRGTRAPSRAHCGVSPQCAKREKFAMARAPSPAREARALPIPGRRYRSLRARS